MLERNLLNRADVERGWTAVLDIIRTRMLAIPSAVAGPAFVAGSLAEVSALLTAAVHNALNDASRPPVYDTPVAFESDAEPHTQTIFGNA